LIPNFSLWLAEFIRWSSQHDSSKKRNKVVEAQILRWEKMNLTSHNATANKTYQADSLFPCPLLDRFLEETRGTLDIIYIVNSAIDAIFSLTAVFTNALVIASIWRASSLRSPMYYLLFGLAVSDFGVGLLAQPSYVLYKVAGLYKRSQLSCVAGISFVLISNQLSGVSFLTVTLISLERVLALYFHLRYKELLTLQRVKLALYVTWLLSASADIAWLTSLKVYYFIGSVGFAIFLTTTLLAYIMISRTVKRHHLQIQRQTVAVLHLRTASSQENPNSRANTIERSKDDAVRFRHLSMAMFLVYLVFLLCILPFMCVLLIASFHGRDTAVETALNFTMTLVFINSTLNPFLYCFRLKTLRREVWDTLRGIASICM